MNADVLGDGVNIAELALNRTRRVQRGRAVRQIDQVHRVWSETVLAPPIERPVPIWRRWWPLVLFVAGFVAIVVLLMWPR